MKRLLVILLFMLFSWTSQSQDKYAVYECSQAARVFRTDSRSWDAITKGETLQENTLLNIKKKGAISILDKSTRRIYSNVKTGKQTVSALIQASSKSANSTFGNLNHQLARNVKNSDHRSRYYSTYGATVRGDGEVTFADSLYYSIFQGITKQTYGNSLVLKETRNNDGTISFSIVNDSDSLFFVSLICGDKSHISLCFDGLIYGADVISVLPHSMANLQSHRFAPPSGNEQYYLIASQREFWVEPLKNALNYMSPPEFVADEKLIQIIPAE